MANTLKHTLLFGLFAAFVPLNADILKPDVITPPDGAVNDSFGQHMSIDGNFLVVGTANDDTNGLNAGAVYVYQFNSVTQAWEYHSKVHQSTPVDRDWFGSSVSINGNIMVAGASGYDSGAFNTGGGYIFRYNENTQAWVQEYKIAPSSLLTEDNMGAAVAVNGNNVMISSTKKYGSPVNSGSVYAYRYDETLQAWSESEIIKPADAAQGDVFGHAISISGDVAIIAASGHDSAGNNAGAAYIYRFNETTQTWDLEKKLTPSGSGWRFGSDVAIDGNTAVAGAPYAAFRNSAGTALYNVGAAYIFNYNESTNEWDQIMFRPTDWEQMANTYIGSSVDVSGKIGVVSAHQKNAAYVFDTTDGGEILKLNSSDGGYSDFFGWAVTIDGDNIVIGAYKADGDRGRAYTGSFKSFTTLDDGISRTINGISFRSQQSWIVGENTGGNTLTLSAGDTADIRVSGTGVYVGKTSASNSNTLIIHGTVLANDIYVGQAGNSGNLLSISATGSVQTAKLHLSLENGVEVAGSLAIADVMGIVIASATDFTAIDMLGGSILFGPEMVLEIDLQYAPAAGTVFELVSTGCVNNSAYLYDGAIISKGDTFFKVISENGMFALEVLDIPEPAACAALIGAIALAFAAYRRRS